MSLLESLKNSLIGKVHMPHSPMINHGIHALTFEAIYSPAVNKKQTQGVIDDVTLQESNKIAKVVGMIDNLLRATDQVDEQLHAGYYFYILTGTGRFVSNSVFVYPVVLLLLAYFIPALIEYYELMESTQEIAILNAQTGSEVKFVAFAYSIGFFFVNLPILIMYLTR